MTVTRCLKTLRHLQNTGGSVLTMRLGAPGKPARRITFRRRPMASIRTAGAVLAAALLLPPGCAKRQPAPQAAPRGSISAGQQMRDALTRANPTARVGIVYAGEPSSQLVGVRDAAVNDFQPGDSVQFLDARGNVIGDGTVVRQKNDAVHIEYQQGGTRAPMVGDL